MPHHARIALVRAQQAGQHGDGGGLPGAVRAEQAEDLALLDGKIHALHSLGLAKGLVQVQDFDGG